MRKMFTLEMKDYLMRMVLFVAVCMVGVGGLKAAPGLSADDPMFREVILKICMLRLRLLRTEY